MIKNDEKKTSLRQRILFIGIAAFMLLSTFALYVGIVLNYDSKAEETKSKTAKSDRLQELYQEYQEEVNQKAVEISSEYFEKFKGYKDRVKAFNAADVTELKTEDLKKGSGDKIEDGTTNINYSAYYIGWLSDGTVFDSSFDSFTEPNVLKFPLAGSTGMIQGWLDGISGMHIGGVRELTIPSILGYGDQEQGSIPANSPLKFIVMLIPKQEEPEYSDEFNQLYEELYGSMQVSGGDTEETSGGEDSGDENSGE